MTITWKPVVVVVVVLAISVPLAVLAASGAATALVPATTSVLQQSRCADCHFANLDAPARDHLSEWDISAHGRAQIGCEGCHGGDAGTFDILAAHRDIVGAVAADSPVNRRNLPRTCGACHTGNYVAFQRSRHLELLEAGDESVPTCSTCHGSVAAHLLSPRALQARCASCHAEDSVAPRPDFAAESRALLERIAAVRELLDEAAGVIRRVRDGDARAAFEADHRQAEVPLLEAVDAAHAFDFGPLEERLATARRRVEDLLVRLAVREGFERPAASPSIERR